MSIKSFFDKLRKDRETKEYDAGYDWAAGSLLRGEMTPMIVESYTLHGDITLFCSGALEAVDRLVTAGVIEDDT